MKRVLFIAPMIGYPPKGGPYLRTLSSIKALNSICELHLISRVPQTSLGDTTAVSYFKTICHRFSNTPSVDKLTHDFDSTFTLINKNKTLIRLTKFLQQFIIFEVCLFFLRSYSDKIAAKKDARYIIDYAAAQKSSIVWFSYASISVDLVREVHILNPNLRLISDTDSVWSRFISRGAPYQSSWLRSTWLRYVAQRKKYEEKYFVNVSSIVTAVSDVDAVYYRSLSSDEKKVFLFSNTLDTESYTLEKLPSNKLIIHFAGSFGVNSPTDQAIRWFINKVFPAVLHTHPTAVLEVVGRESSLALSDIHHPNISVIGEVESVVTYLQKATVVIVPLFFESGTRYKILEAGALKKPVVSTTLGAEGLAVLDKRNILIADNPEDFSESVSEVLSSTSLQSTLGSSLHKLIQKKYSLDQHKKEGLDILNFLS